MNIFSNLKIKLLTFLLIILTACSSLDPKPFEKIETVFNDAEKEMDDPLYSKSLSSPLDSIEKSAKERIKKEMIENRDEIYKLDLKFKTDKETKHIYIDFIDSPYYLQINQFNSSFESIFKSLKNYYAQLSKLADPNEIYTNESATQDSTTLNNNLMNIATTLNNNTVFNGEVVRENPPKEPENIALLATLGTGVFQQHINRQRRDALTTTLIDDRSSIRSLSNFLVEGLNLATRTLRFEYQEQMKLARKDISPASAIEEVETAVETSLNLNDQIIKQMELLKKYIDFFETLPDAHEQLIKSVNNEEISIDYILSLSSTIESYSKVYNTNLLSNKVILAQAEVNKLNAYKNEASAEIKAIDHQIKSAELSLELYNNQLSNIPTNGELQDKIKQTEFQIGQMKILKRSLEEKEAYYIKLASDAQNKLTLLNQQQQ